MVEVGEEYMQQTGTVAVDDLAVCFILCNKVARKIKLVLEDGPEENVVVLRRLWNLFVLYVNG